ncbi:MAG: hypothetical protein ACJ8GN_17925 [Longimicrobiaceae bacterium]
MADKHTGPVFGMLAVADPRPKAAIGDWSPFRSGSPLGEIVDECNERCLQTYRSTRWAPQDIKALSALIDLLPFDLSHVEELESTQLSTLRIILLDAGAVARLGSGAEHLIDRLKVLIPKLEPTRLLRLVQVRGDDGVPSWADEFASLPVKTDSPGFVGSETELKAFLLRFCEILDGLQQGLALPPSEFRRPGGPDPRQQGRGKPFGGAMGLLDVALREDLSVEDATRFARAVSHAPDRWETLVLGTSSDALGEVARAVKSGLSDDEVQGRIERDTLTGRMGVLDAGFPLGAKGDDAGLAAEHLDGSWKPRGGSGGLFGGRGDGSSVGGLGGSPGDIIGGRAGGSGGGFPGGGSGRSGGSGGGVSGGGWDGGAGGGI